MIQTGFESKVKVQQIINNQLPSFVLDENPKSVDFLKQYYISQEYQGGPVDIAENLDEYLKLDNLTPEVVVDSTYITSGISSTDTTISVNSTKGFPQKYGLLKIDNEIITYTGLTTNTFTGCQRGFSGITSYHDDLNQEELVFSDTTGAAHIESDSVQNLSSLFLKEFYKKLKYTFAPGLEDVEFVDTINAGNFIKEAKSFYQAKGTDESFRILFNILYGATPRVVNLEDFLIKPSASQYVRREVAIAEVISGDPQKLVGQTITKSTDSGTSASISEIEPFTRDNRQYFKLSLFIGYDELSTIQGMFGITPSTKSLETVAIGASVVSVDSTIGFAKTGMVISGINSITYSNKTINQFLGCTGIETAISAADNIRSDEIYYGFEDGDITKRVELRLTGVLSDFIQLSDNLKVAEDDTISVRNVGELIENPEQNKTYKEIFGNSWIYNTSSTYEIESFGTSLTLTLKSDIDKSSLKKGDRIEIVQRGGSDDGKVVYPTSTSNIPYVDQDIPRGQKSISLSNFSFTPSTDVEYGLRRKLNKVSSLNVPVEYGNDVLISDIQNVYTVLDEDVAYVASNSLPSNNNGLSIPYAYQITKNINSASINSLSSLTNKNSVGQYTTLTFGNAVPFITGDRVYYEPDSDPLEGLVSKLSYYVEVLSDKKSIKLYNSLVFIGTDSYVTFDVPASGIGNHKFTVYSQRSDEIGSQKIFKKFELPPNNKVGTREETVPGSTGMLINGVEISNYKSLDRIYYGPLESIDVMNGGSGYDVINLPSVTASAGIGSTALLRPVISGSIEKVYVDVLDYDIEDVESVNVTGGNGTGAVLKPIVVKRSREVSFDGRGIEQGGGVSTSVNGTTHQITFLTAHNFANGQEVIYDSNSNLGIGVGIGTSTLVDKASYFTKIDNNTTVRLFYSYNDYSLGINPVGFNTINTTGIHKFKTKDVKKTISEIKVLDGGKGYTNRKLIVKPTGISTSKNIINFKNHGFNDGEIINYSYDTTPIEGLSTEDDYYILKLDDDKFQLANFGIVEQNLGSVYFDGSSDHLDLDASSDFSFGTGDFTIEFWIKTAVHANDGGRNLRIWNTDGPTGHQVGNLQIMITNSPAGVIWVFDDNSNLNTAGKGATAVSDDEWHHIAVSRESGVLKLFVDGLLDMSTTYSTGIGTDGLNSGAPRVRIGSFNGTAGDFNGNISNLRVNKGTALYTQEFVPSKRPLKNVSGTVLLSCKDSKSVSEYDVSPTKITNTGAGVSESYPFTLASGQDYYYNSRESVDLTNIGVGYQNFAYPDILVTVNYTPVGLGTTTQSKTEVVSTPLVRGSIIDTYVYESGVGYGSSILNLEKKPKITVKTGRDAQLKPIVLGGLVDSVNIQFGGFEYYSIPDLNVIDSTGMGSGAELRPVISDGKITDVKVINAGIGYSASSTSIQVKSTGINAKFDARIRQLSVSNIQKFGNEILEETKNNKLKYSVGGYFGALRDSFNESASSVSGIIGWAYDGNPIYGPYGYEDVTNANSSPKRLSSGYGLSTSRVEDRPPEFDDGFFIEDYEYTNSGDLDVHNGRFSITPDFPNGVYAYHATIDSSGNPQFPYFIGNEYRTNTIEENKTNNQSFDFNNSNLLRNTFPYKVSDKYADNDFLIETNEISRQRAVIESIDSGFVNGFDVLNSGTKYKVNDILHFDDSGTEGGGLISKVASLKGSDILNIETSIETYEDAIFSWVNENKVKVSILPKHNLRNNDNIVISGFSTYLTELNNPYQIGITSYYSNLLSTCFAGAATTEIYVTQLPPSVSVGSSVGIGNSICKVLNVFPNLNVLRIEKFAGIAHSATTRVDFIPDSFTVPQKIDYFESSVNDKMYFNASESVGVGTTPGAGITTTFTFGDSLLTRVNPTQSIYVEKHPFITNQPVNLTVPSGGTLSISTSATGTPFNLPASGLTTTVFIVNKTINTIGIKTGIGTDHTGNLYEEIFFRNTVPQLLNDDRFLLESIFTQKTGKVQRINSVVSVAATHELTAGDTISLVVEPKGPIGVGSTPGVVVKRDSSIENIVINPINIEPDNIDTVTNQLTVTSHNLYTGDKVAYAASLPASGLSTSTYYVYKVNDDVVKLSKTYVNVTKNPPIVVSIASTGGATHTITPINPRISSVKSNSLRFDLSDSSLSGYDFKIYYDNEFNNEFVSTGTSTGFTLVGVGTAGITTNASLTINYNTTSANKLPERLYYNLEKSGYLSTADTEVKNHSEILFIDSTYTSDYVVSGVSSYTFNISLNSIPEKTSYISTDCSTFEYTTKSKSAKGSIDKASIISGGSGYKKLPKFAGSSSVEGTGAYLRPTSNTIGNINKVRIINEGFEYSSDRTLQPNANISPLVTLKDSNTIGIVTVTNGGRHYTTPPNIIVVNTDSGEIIDNGILKASLSANAIISVDVIQGTKGLSEETSKLYAVENTNGISIQKVIKDSDTKFTCRLTTPTLGFSTDVFSAGEKVFIEGIQKVGTAGSGFNSEDYGYTFLTVESYKNSKFVGAITQDEVTINVSGLTTNTGIAKTIQDSFGSIIKKGDYPTFIMTQTLSDFKVGEKLSSNGVERDLIIKSYDEGGYIKVDGSYQLSVGEIIRGKETGTIATIDKLENNAGRFIVGYANKKDIGWDDSIGKLNEDMQVIANNDYYQNLSYTIKSPIEWKDLRTPVNSLVHTSGLKNFADTGITSTATVGIGSSNATTIVRDVLEELRVDTIYNFDNVLDVDVLGTQSKFLKLENRKLTDYTLSKTNIVLKIDNINDLFNDDEGDPSEYTNLYELSPSVSYDSVLVRITNTVDSSDIQLTDLVIMNDSNDRFLLEKGSLDNAGIALTHTAGNAYGTFTIGEDKYLRFTPVETYSTDYDLKFIKSNFGSASSGIGTTSIGCVDLTSFSGIVTSGGSGITSSIVGVATTKYRSLHVNAQVLNSTTNALNFVELYLTHDGDNTYLAESYFDSTTQSYSGNFIGSFTSNINSGILYLNYTNDTSDDIKIKSKIVGFAATTLGIGTYRYQSPGQTDGSERSAIYQSDFSETVGASPVNVLTLNNNLFNAAKSIVEVGMGTSKALHEVLMVEDGSDVYVQQSSFLSVGSASTNTAGKNAGLGTFGGYYYGSDLTLKFFPDAAMTANMNIAAFSECLYTTIDVDNTPNQYSYGDSTETLDIKFYNALGGTRINRLDFPVRTDGTYIFAKSFDPTSSSELNMSTGVFTIKDHFFRTGETLAYTPKSTIIGIGSTALTYAGVDDGGIGIHTLPSVVYAIREDDDNFKLATTRVDANAGIASYITFGSFGEGNAHELAMTKTNSKAIITIDNIIQSPLTFTPISYKLSGNPGGSVGKGTTIFALSGISTLNPTDILKIDDEYVKVQNVGLGSTAVGPITGAGTSTLVHVERAFAGSEATSHTDTTTARVYKGAFNIVGKKIYFTEAPRGNSQIAKDNSNLDFPTSDFGGRVFLRENYDTNQIYDDLSDQFTGIGRTFGLTVGGANTAGIGSTGGNGIVVINGIFQTPTTVNNPENNFTIIDPESNIAGVSTLIFSGITSTDGTQYISPSDVNRNQLPRGGVIVSLGSSGGLGYAPLVGAQVRAQVNSLGAVTGIVGIGTTAYPKSRGAFSPPSSLAISTASYTNTTGLLKVTTVEPHGLVLGIVNEVTMVGLHFTCRGTFDVSGADYNEVTGDLTLAIGDHNLSVGEGIRLNNNSLVFKCDKDSYGSTHSYPRAGTDPIAGISTPITSIGATTITINAGIGTISKHTFASAVAGAVRYGDEHSGVTTSIFPDAANDRPFAITGINSTNTFTANVGISTIPHMYVGQGTVFAWYGDLTYGSGYNDAVSIGVSITDVGYAHTFIGAATGAVTGTGGPFTPTNAVYASDTGVLTLTIPSHGRTSGNVQIVQNSLVFTCSRDNHQTFHNYPRSTDPAGGSRNLKITKIDDDTLSVNVGAASSGNGAIIHAHPVGVNTHTFVSAATNGIRRLSGTPGDLTATTDTTYVPSTGVLTIKTTGTHSLSAETTKNITAATYTPTTGILSVTSASHGFTTGDYVKIVDNSLTFTCTLDGGVSSHTYPRSSDPISNKWISIVVVDSNKFTINVGISTAGNYAHTYTGGTATNAIKKANSFVGFATGSLTFTCAQDSHSTLHTYPRTTDPFHWTDGKVLGVETVASTTLFTVNVGKSPNGSGGALAFNIVSAGSSYRNPEIYVSEPRYDNLTIEGISRLSIGPTTDTGTNLLMDLGVSAASTTGIGSNTFEVSSFDISRNGYGFRRGDIFTPVGLVTHRTLQSAISKYELTVNDVFQDTFAAWQFGELDFIDSIKNYQDGVRTRFPLYYNDELLSFEKEEGSRVDLTNALLVVVNGIIQDPDVAYVFDGGTSFGFVTAPKVEDNVDVFFYRGTRNIDDQLVTSINQTIERGDAVQVFKNNAINGTVTQDKRTVFDLSYSDKFETNKYIDQGIDEINYKPLSWIKQKTDGVLNGEIVYKDRDSIEPLVFPTAKIIDTIGSSDTELFVEDADLFKYDSATDFSGIIVSGAADPVAADVTATVSAAGTVSGFVINDGGSGISTCTVSIAAPLEIGVGVGTTATGTATLSAAGAVTGITINNIGFGYTSAPTVLVSTPSPVYENISGIDVIQGFSGIVTGISTCVAIPGTASTTAIKFTLHRDTANYTDLNVGHPIYVYDTRCGHGITSVASNDLSVIGVGQTFVDNVYMIQEISNVGAAGSIICYVMTGYNGVGVGSTGSVTNPVGKFSWGRLAGISRSSTPVSIAVTGNTVDVGLTTFPTIQRRGTGLRDTGALPKKT